MSNEFNSLIVRSDIRHIKQTNRQAESILLQIESAITELTRSFPNRVNDDLDTISQRILDLLNILDHQDESLLELGAKIRRLFPLTEIKLSSNN